MFSFGIITICCIVFNILVQTAVSDVVHCPEVAKIDCANGYKAEGNETVCCSDLQVYPNFCFFAQQKCKDATLTILYLGNCVSTTHQPVSRVTTPSNNIATISPPTADPVYIVSSVFCSNKDQIDCRDDLDPVCGTDNTFYQNNCEFFKARCENDMLNTQDLSVCKTAQRFKRELSFV